MLTGPAKSLSQAPKLTRTYGCEQVTVPSTKRGFHKIFLDLVTTPSALPATPDHHLAAVDQEREDQVCREHG